MLTAQIVITDNAANSPQTINLTGGGAQNAVPMINQPVVPTASAPGGTSFTLGVRGTGFVNGSVVNWNGHARLTTFVSSSQLQANILAADIASVGTAVITVSNPGVALVSNVVYFQITNATATIGFNESSISAGLGARTMVEADFNGDGKLDLAICHDSAGNTIAVLLGNGDGTFQPPVNYATGTDTTHLAVGDFNGDGKLDLVATNGGDNTVSILLGNGDGTFQTRTSYSTGTFPIGVATGDFNGDGKLDVVVTNKSAGTVAILLGNGDGTLQPHTDYAIAGGADTVFVGDFNGDGKLDLAAECGNSVSILLGNGDGTFNSHVDYAVGSTPQWIAGADLNGDGKLDLVTANILASSVSILLGNGDGTFKTHVDYSTGAYPQSVAIGDLNGDGRVDLVTANCLAATCANPSSISVLLGNGDGTFQNHNDSATGFAPLSILVGDFNGDGELDIATSNQGDGTVSLFLQTTGGAPPQTAPSFVQAVSALCGSGPQCSNTMSFSTTTKAGNAILVPLWFNALNVAVQVSDSNGDAFQLWATVPTADTNDSPAFLYGARNVVGGNVTVNLKFSCPPQTMCNPQSGVPASVFAGALEYQGITTGVDASITAGKLLTQQSQGQIIDSGTFVTHFNSELAFGIGMADFGVQSESGWTARLGCIPSQSGYFCFEEQTATKPGSFDATFVTDFSSAGGLGGPPSVSAPNGYGISAISVY